MTNAREADRLLTQLQETGSCDIKGLTLAFCLDLVETLGVDPAAVKIENGRLSAG